MKQVYIKIKKITHTHTRNHGGGFVLLPRNTLLPPMVNIVVKNKHHTHKLIRCSTCHVNHIRLTALHNAKESHKNMRICFPSMSQGFYAQGVTGSPNKVR